MTPNDIVYIKPTEGGWREIVAYVDNFNDHIRTTHPGSLYRIHVPVADKDGYIKGQFRSLMQYFNWSVGCGSDIHFHDLRPNTVMDREPPFPVRADGGLLQEDKP